MLHVHEAPGKDNRVVEIHDLACDALWSIGKDTLGGSTLPEPETACARLINIFNIDIED